MRMLGSGTEAGSVHALAVDLPIRRDVTSQQIVHHARTLVRARISAGHGAAVHAAAAGGTRAGGKLRGADESTVHERLQHALRLRVVQVEVLKEPEVSS